MVSWVMIPTKQLPRVPFVCSRGGKKHIVEMLWRGMRGFVPSPGGFAVVCVKSTSSATRKKHAFDKKCASLKIGHLDKAILQHRLLLLHR